MKPLQPFAESQYALPRGHLRLLREEDSPFIAAQLAAMDPWRALNYRALDLARYLRAVDPALRRYAVRSAAGNLAGVICVRYPWLRGPYLELLGLTADHQGLGLGGELMEWFSQQARLGARNAWVVVSAFNRRAHAFYLRHGFTDVGVIEGLVNPGCEEILLRKVVQKSFGSAPNGEIKGFFSIISDVTAEQKQEEERRRQLAAFSRTARLVTVDRMATEIAHEINQPLTAIANYSTACLRALQNGQPGSKVMGWLEQINAQAKRTSQIVLQLRAFIRKGEIPPAVVDIDQLVKEVIDCIAVEARAHGIAVSIQPAGVACRLLADGMLIEQVILNLLGNAMEALAEVTGRERRLLLKVTRRAGAIDISVCDNGPGIPPELGDRIFEPFVTSRRDGLGLGLAICRSVVEAHGGALTVISTPGEGATFTFNLPMTDTGEDA